MASTTREITKGAKKIILFLEEAIRTASPLWIEVEVIRDSLFGAPLRITYNKISAIEVAKVTENNYEVKVIRDEPTGDCFSIFTALFETIKVSGTTAIHLISPFFIINMFKRSSRA